MLQLSERLFPMEERPVIGQIVKIAWPAMVESFFVASTTLIDSFMLSELGYSAVAAVGLTAQPKFIAISPFLSVNVAINALTARRKGQGDRDDAHSLLQTAFWFALLGGILIGVLCAAFADPLMRLVGSDSETHAMAAQYFRIIMGGIVFHVVSLAINAAQRGSGKTNLSMRTNVASSAVNIVFNWLLITGNLGFPALGVTGAAAATVLGSAVGCGMSVLSLFAKDSFLSVTYLLKHQIHVTQRAVKAIVNFASNVLVENILIRLGYMATALMAARLGAEALAAHNVGLNLLTLSFSVGDGIQVAAISLIGQSLGQNAPEQAKHYGNLCQKVGIVASACMTVLYLLGGRWLFTLFFPADPVVVDHGVMIVHRLIITIIVQVSEVVYLGSLRGAGDVRYVMVALIVSVTIVRAGSGFLFCEVLGMGLPGLWLSIIADQVSRYLFTSIRFKQGKWTKLTI